MRHAKAIAEWSKDPSTKCGATIVDTKRRVVSSGFNGFPRMVDDSQERLEDRETKLFFTIHAEMNALLRAGGDLLGCAMYVWPFSPCASCAACIAQKGISTVFHPPITPELARRWGDSCEAGKTMLKEAGIGIVEMVI